EAVLISGDGDFGYPVEKLIKERGKKVTVISTWRSVGKELPASGAKVIFLDDLIPMLTYTRKPNVADSTPQLKVV
ncbi:MAG: NYN domain-containing protein, partial [bacterium]|nr:NYN domain-containing protein [bacterium]